MAFEQTYIPDSTNVLGAFLPKIYVSKISLDLGSAASAGGNIFINDPHVGVLQYDQSYLKSKPKPNEYDNDGPQNKWKSVPRHIGQNLSPFGTNRDLIITAELQVKDKVVTDSFFSWILNKDIADYLEYVVFTCTDPKIAQSMTTDVKFKNALINKLTGQNVKTSVDVTKAYEEVKENVIAGNVKSDFFSMPGKNLESISTEMDSSGNTIYNFSTTAKFTVKDNTNPNYLSLFAYTYLNVEAMALKYEFDSVDIPESVLEELSAFSGAFEIILQDGEIMANAQQFKDKKGFVWLGPVHQMPNGQIMKGAAHDPSKHLNSAGQVSAQSLLADVLTVEKVLNTKIHDFRDIYEVEKLELDFTKFTEFFTDLHGPTLDYEYHNKQKYYPYFSNLRLASDTKGRCRFMFDMDYSGFIKDNSQYPGFFAVATKNKDEIFNFSNIISMKIFRRRVASKPKLYNRLGTALRPISYERDRFQEDVFPVKIVESSEKSLFTFRRKEYYEQKRTIDAEELRDTRTTRSKASSPKDKELIGTLKEYDFFTDLLSTKLNKTIRTFSGVDHNIASFNSGFYQYGVRIEIQDPTMKYLRSKLEALRANAEIWQKYYKFVLSNPEFQDAYTGRFTKKFLQSQADTSGDPKFEAAMPAAIDFLTTMGTLVSANTSVIDKVVFNLTLISSPTYGNVKGIDVVSKLMNNFLIKFEKLTRDLVTEKRSFAVNGDNSRLNPDKKDKQRIKIEYWFNEIYDASVTANNGYEYTSIEPDMNYIDDKGLKVITNLQMQARVDTEYARYVNPDQAIIIKNGNTTPALWAASPQYLTPIYANLADGTRHSLFNKKKSALGNFALDVLYYNNGGGVFDVENKDKLKHLLGTLGCSYAGSPGKNSNTESGWKNDLASAASALKNLYGTLAKPPLVVGAKNVLFSTNTFQALKNKSQFKIKNYAINKVLDFSDDFSSEDLKEVGVDKINPNPLFYALVGIANLGQSEYSDFIRMFDFVTTDGEEYPIDRFENKLLKAWEKWSEPSPSVTGTSATAVNAATSPTLIAASTTSPLSAAASALMAKAGDPISNLPPQLLTLAAHHQADPNDMAKESIPTFNNIAMKELQNRKIARIMVLEGYEGKSLKNEIWRDLNQSDLLGNGTPVAQLCKISFYGDSLTGVGRRDPLHLPIYDEHFVLTVLPDIFDSFVVLPKPPATSTSNFGKVSKLMANKSLGTAAISTTLLSKTFAFKTAAEATTAAGPMVPPTPAAPSPTTTPAAPTFSPAGAPAATGPMSTPITTTMIPGPTGGGSTY